MTQRQWCHRSRVALIAPEKFSWTDLRYWGTEKYVRKVSLNSDSERGERHCIFRVRSVRSHSCQLLGLRRSVARCVVSSREFRLEKSVSQNAAVAGETPLLLLFSSISFHGATLLQQFPYNAFMHIFWLKFSMYAHEFYHSSTEHLVMQYIVDWNEDIILKGQWTQLNTISSDPQSFTIHFFLTQRCFCFIW